MNALPIFLLALGNVVVAGLLFLGAICTAKASEAQR